MGLLDVKDATRCFALATPGEYRDNVQQGIKVTTQLATAQRTRWSSSPISPRMTSSVKTKSSILNVSFFTATVNVLTDEQSLETLKAELRLETQLEFQRQPW